MLDFKILEVDYHCRENEMLVKANSKVSSVKTFPIYTVNGQKMLFKPLSYTKPLTTPFFAYAEVFWSFIFHQYFDNNIPLYTLAYCWHFTDFISKYYCKGTLVPLQQRKNCKIMNLYDYFILHPDENVNIKDYVNYCGKTYDYTTILRAKIFMNNENLSEKLAYYILLSILKLDYNFHYENILLYVENDKIVDLVPMLDHEFSLYFLFPDTNLYIQNFEYYFDDIVSVSGTCYQNIAYIKKTYPHIYHLFIENVQVLKNNFTDYSIPFDKKFVGKFSTHSWLIGDARYKQHDERKAQDYERELEFLDADKFDFDKWNKRLRSSINILMKTLIDGND